MTDRNGHIEVFPGGEAVPPLLTPVETVKLLRLDVNGDQERSEVDALKSLEHLIRTKRLRPRRPRGFDYQQARQIVRPDLVRVLERDGDGGAS